jgi:hypothetical protein
MRLLLRSVDAQRRLLGRKIHEIHGSSAGNSEHAAVARHFERTHTPFEIAQPTFDTSGQVPRGDQGVRFGTAIRKVWTLTRAPIFSRVTVFSHLMQTRAT